MVTTGRNSNKSSRNLDWHNFRPGSSAEQVNLLVLLVLLILPFALMLYQSITEIHQRIETSQLERSGIAYLRPLERLLLDVPQAKLTAHRYFRQDAAWTEVEAWRSRLLPDFAALTTAEQNGSSVLRDGTQRLGTTDLYQTLQQDWQTLQVMLSNAPAQSAPSTSAASVEIQKHYDRLLVDVRSLITQVGNRSSLILDPDLSSYYLMDTILLKLPEAQDLLGQVRQLGEDVVDRQAMTSEEKGRLVVQMGLLKESVDELRQGLAIALQNPLTSQTPYPSQPLANDLQTAVKVPTQEFVAAVARFLNSVNDAMVQTKTVQIKPTTYDFSAYNQGAIATLLTSDRLWQQTAAQLDQWLSQRIQKFQQKINLLVALVVVVLTITTVFFVVFSRKLTERHRAEQRQEAQYAIARLLTEANQLDDAAPRLLQTVCESLDWDLGELWSIDQEGESLRFVAMWHSPALADEPLQVNYTTTFKKGVGLPGRVWAKQSPLWIPDLATDPGFVRPLIVEELRLHGAFGCPVLSGDELLGVMVFFSHTIQLPDLDLLNMLASVGTQVGQFIKTKQAEAALRFTEELQRLALSAANMGVWDWNVLTNEEHWSEETERLFGFEPGMFQGGYQNFLDCVHPDDREHLQSTQQRAFQEGTDYVAEYRISWKDGSTHWMTSRGRVLRDEAGQPARFCGVTMNITARKEAEAAMQQLNAQLGSASAEMNALFASMNDLILLSDRGGYCLKIPTHNPNLLYQPADALIGRNLHEIFPPETATQFLNYTLQALEAQQTLEVEYSLMIDGREVWSNASISPVDGDRVVWVIRDITQRKQFEQELQHAKEVAEDSNRSKSQFLANMSHELRTPLNAIIGYSEMLQEDAEDLGCGDIVPDLKKIRGAGKHLLDLINDILDISKIEAGRMDLYLEEFNIAQLVREVQSTIQPLVEKNHNQLLIDCDPALGSMTADLTKVRQSLLNLLSNAAKFTENGTIRLTVNQVSELDTGIPNSFVKFQVADTGIGMTLEQMQRIFQAFTQADASTTRKYGGSGLGLAISQRFCQMMGGDITVASELGSGSTFTLWLPLDGEAAQQGMERSPTTTSDRPPATHPPTPIGKTILVIDDDVAVRELVARSLMKAGFTVHTAADGETGLQQARDLHPDAITLDVLLPTMTGWSVLAALKADPILAEIPVVVMTIVDDKNRGFALGASDYLTKPVDYKRLTALLHRFRPQSTVEGAPPGHVLLVEDDADIRQMFRRMLEREGWQVMEAENGRVGLEQIPKFRPDLVLLDLMMPEMDGFQFISELRQWEEWRSLPIIVITALDLTPNDHLRLNGYVEQILQKDAYNTEDLLREVHEMVLTCLRFHHPAANRVRASTDTP